MRDQPRGFTIVELLVVISIIALLIAILLPAIGKARDAALVTQSLGNMRNLSAANASYGADWTDRQFTAAPDDAGLVNGSCSAYITQIACPPQQLLGWAAMGSIWGYFIGTQGFCAWPGDCGSWSAYRPIEFGGANSLWGAFRLPNVKAFSAYVNNRFYDPVFWAPKDRINIGVAEKYFMLPDQFTYDNVSIAFSTYCFSPAAMWAPEVFYSEKGFKDPNTLVGGYRSPAAGQARYPDLKTRMLEHSWLQNAESAVNPNFSGGNEPWYFNHGYNSAPVSLFFDGHVSVMSVADAMESDSRAQTAAPQGQAGLVEKGLWHRGTPLGASGYYGAQSYDFLVNTSYHVFTTNGILGRDTIGAK